MNQDCIFVLGVHRSGTSALMGTLNSLGVEIGTDLLPPSEDNPKGFYENNFVHEINEKILTALNSSWDDLFTLPHNWWNQDYLFNDYQNEVTDFVKSQFSNTNIFGIKDPRLCRLLPFWKKVFDELLIKTHCVISLRNPFEVANSLVKRNGFSIEKSLLLWMINMMEADLYTKDIPRVFISFESLIKDPEIAVKHLLDTLNIKFPVKYKDAEDEISNFLDAKLKHYNVVTRSTGNESLDLISEFYNILLNVDEKNKIDNESLFRINEIREKYIDTIKLFYNKDIKKTIFDTKNIEVTVNENRDRIGILKAEALKKEDRIGILEAEALKKEDRIGIFEAEAKKKEDRVGILEAEGLKNEDILAHIYISHGWKGLLLYYRFRDNLLPVGSRRRSAVKLLFRYPIKLRNLNIKKIFIYLKIYGFKGFFRKINATVNENGTASYTEWIGLYDTLSLLDRSAIQKRIDQMEFKPLISVVMPVYNPEEKWLRLAIESVRKQLYPNWELCIADDHSSQPHVSTVLEHYQSLDTRIKVIFRSENGNISQASNSALELVKGDFIAMLDHDDELSEHGLYLVAEELNRNPELDFLYSDQDMIDNNGRRYNPYFKPDFNPDLLRSQNFVDHLAVFRASSVRELGGWRSEFDGSQDYDLVLRVMERTTPSRIKHIPYVLYHWRAVPGSIAHHVGEKDYAPLRSRLALTEHLQRLRVQADVTSHYPDYSIHRVIYPLPAEPPLVSIIVPTKDGLEFLSRCIDGLLHKTDYPEFEIIIVNNRSENPETYDYFEKISKDSRIKIIDFNQSFNYSKINNFAVHEAKGSVINFLNNDTEVINRDWLREMVSQAIRPEIGAVGARLYYEDDTVQHAGIFLGFKGRAGHIYRYTQRHWMGDWARGILIQNYSAVTAACMVIRREVYEEVGGFDEQRLSITFNDVDLCLRILEKGYRNLYTPFAELYHFESKTRGLWAIQSEEDYFENNWKHLINADPAYNPNLTLELENLTPAFPPRVRHPWSSEDIDMSISSGTPLVTIITRTYGERQALLSQSLESIIQQTYRPIQIVIVEDGSNYTRSLVEKMSLPEGISIDYESLPKRGRCYAGNRGLELASGELIGFLDDDDLFLPDHIESLVAHLFSNPSAEVAYSLAWEVSTEIVAMQPLTYTEGRKKVIGANFSLSRLWHYNFIPIQSIIFHKKLYMQHGGFNEELDCLEDWDLWLRYSAEKDFIFLNKLTSIFRIPATQDTLARRREEHHEYLPVIRTRQTKLLEQYGNTSFYERLSAAYDAIT